MKIRSIIRYALIGVVAVLIGVTAFIQFRIIPGLPSIEMLRDVQLQVPLRIYTTDGKLIGEFGEKKRSPLRYGETPPRMIQAVLAAEDDRFFQHPGVDYQGILRAVYTLVVTREKSQGGSTITMQVARNFFLSSEKTYLRKVNEIFLSFKIEEELSKEEILELYLNKIYLGNRAYGVGAAALVYYGKPVHQLSLAQMAMIAGLPKAPSRYNPIANLERATLRRNYVLRRMRELNYISDEEYRLAVSEADDARLYAQPIDVEAPYVAEMVRAEAYARFGEEAYTQGLKIYTTLDSRLQASANTAVRAALQDYDQRHGYRGPLGHAELADFADAQQRYAALREYSIINDLQPAIVTEVKTQEVTAHAQGDQRVRIGWDGLSWATRSTTIADVLKRGDIIQVYQSNGQWRLGQTPMIEGALVSISPNNGAIRALNGGYNFYKSKFNRVVQGQRQPGSAFKPFIYAAALEKGYTPATVVNDAPVVFEDAALETMWRPENYSGEFFGPTRLREALTHSRNLVSIRLLQDIGIGYAVQYATRFGFSSRQMPRDLSLALGSGSTSPLELARGYAVFANGGYLVDPYFIERIETATGKSLYQAYPTFSCTDCDGPPPSAPEQPATPEPQTAMNAGMVKRMPAVSFAPEVINPQVVYQMNSVMGDVIRYGTARRARELGRSDLHGKTGTTNDQFDAWFAGFNTALATTVWIGFDQPQALGERESGGRSALPMWIDYMKVALAGLPEIDLPQPPGMVTVRIDPATGKLASSRHPDAIFETFRADFVPQEEVELPTAGSGSPYQPSATKTAPPSDLF